jgi:hypothetical protein
MQAESLGTPPLSLPVNGGVMESTADSLRWT